jgi:hypothetical protein
VDSSGELDMGAFATISASNGDAKFSGGLTAASGPLSSSRARTSRPMAHSARRA